MPRRISAAARGATGVERDPTLSALAAQSTARRPYICTRVRVHTSSLVTRSCLPVVLSASSCIARQQQPNKTANREEKVR